MLAAGLPDEAYEMDLLGSPAAYKGTDAYVNLVDLLGCALEFRTNAYERLLQRQPNLLDVQSCQVSLPDVVAMLKRFGNEVIEVVQQYFPNCQKLFG